MINWIFFFPLKVGILKSVFDYLINIQYIENLEEVLFFRGVESGVWGFLFVEGIFAAFFAFLHFIAHWVWHTDQDFVLEYKKAWCISDTWKKIVTAVFNLGYV